MPTAVQHEWREVVVAEFTGHGRVSPDGGGVAVELEGNLVGRQFQREAGWAAVARYHVQGHVTYRCRG